MVIFLAGGVSGNCYPMWRELAEAQRRNQLDVYLAGTQGRRWCVDAMLSEELRGGHSKQIDSQEQKMNLHLAGTMYGNMGAAVNDFASGGDLAVERERDLRPEPERERESDSVLKLAILESFYYADEWTEWVIPRVSEFMLDSGAFTFMENSDKAVDKAVDWDEYLGRYIDFINRNDVKLFFELDIDSIVGYERVLELRARLEEGTGKKCIPVWHKSRGYAEFLKMCDDYPYVAIGGIVSGEIPRSQYKAFPHLIAEAHKRGAKIHGLGFTNLKWLEKCHFDSVDSTAWTTGNRFGSVYQFDGKTMVKHNKPEGHRLADPRKAAVNNFNEWVKFQDYARTHL